MDLRADLKQFLGKLEENQNEMLQLMNETQNFIRSADLVLRKVDDRVSGSGKEFNGRKTSLMTQTHWQTYASHDWFAGFKNYAFPIENNGSNEEFRGKVENRWDEIERVLNEICFLWTKFDNEIFVNLLSDDEEEDDVKHSFHWETFFE